MISGLTGIIFIEFNETEQICEFVNLLIMKDEALSSEGRFSVMQTRKINVT